MAESALSAIPGGQSLVDWFGYVPGFHDAEVLEIRLASSGSSVIRIHTWELTDKIDERGFYVTDKHAVVTITLETVTHVALSDFSLPGIIFDLDVTSTDSGIELDWSGSYGVFGTLRAKRMRIDLQPGKPDGLPVG